MFARVTDFPQFAYRWRAKSSLAIGFLLLLLLSLLPQSVSAAPALPAALNSVGKSEQVVLVQAKNWNATRGTLRAFAKIKGSWVEVHKKVPVDLGYGGLVQGDKRRQGTGKTPTGTYAITSGFGRKADPGTKLDYIKIDRNDAWTYNPRVPSTYNIFQTANRSWKSYGNYVESLYSYGKQYNYVAIMDFNLPRGKITKGPQGIYRTDKPANTQRGGGIFLHVSNGNETAGCIAVAEVVMRDLMKWFNPKKNPVIVVEVTK